MHMGSGRGTAETAFIELCLSVSRTVSDIQLRRRLLHLLLLLLGKGHPHCFRRLPALLESAGELRQSQRGLLLMGIKESASTETSDGDSSEGLDMVHESARAPMC